MVIDLENIFNNDNSRYAFDYSFDLDKSGLMPGSAELSAINVKGEVRNNTGIVSLEAAAVYSYDARCDRCAKAFSRTVSVPIRHFLIASLNGEDNDEYIVVENMRLNLDELIRENVLLLFPMRVLCGADCAGLCMQCGADLNEGACGCKKAVDPRFAALAELLED